MRSRDRGIFPPVWHGCIEHNANHCSQCRTCDCHLYPPQYAPTGAPDMPQDTPEPRHIADQRAHLARTADVYARLLSGELDWRNHASTPADAERAVFKQLTDARDLLAAWLTAP